MKIELIDKGSTIYPKLLEFINKYGLLFNSPEWLQNYPASAISQCAILNNNHDIIGCFMYYRFKKLRFQFIISPPFSPHVALFYQNPSESVVGKNSFHKEVLRDVASYFDSLGVSYIDISLPEEIVDTQPFIWNGYTARTRYSYLLDLSLSPEKLWENLSSEKRKSVNKAEKDGLIISETWDMNLVYDLILRSLERNNLVKNTEIIKHLLFTFASKTNSFAYVAHHHERPIGATFCLITPHKAIYLFGGFDSENKHHGAGVSCMWQSILKAKALNLEYFDFEGSMNPAIERYFREFGGKLIPYYSVQKIKPFLKALLKLKKHNPA